VDKAFYKQENQTNGQLE